MDSKTQKYKIGDKVYFARIEVSSVKEICPDCFGKLWLTVILGDDSRVEIPCVTCEHRDQWDIVSVPKGYVTYNIWNSAKISESKINRVEIKSNGDFEYGIDLRYSVETQNLFSTLAEAELRAEELAREESVRAKEEFLKRKKPEHTWAWNVSYHRRGIKDAEKELEYHKSKIIIASSHVKAEKLEVKKP